MSTATKEQPVATNGTVVKLDYKKKTDANGLAQLAKPLLPQIKAALPGFMAKNADRMVRALLTECQKTPALLDCTPMSLFGAVIQVAQLGLELGGPTGQAYLIPFKSVAQLIIGYKGFVTLAHRSGQVQRITPRIVREGDTFDLEFGTTQRILHKPRMDATGDAVGYYAVVELANVGIDFEYMTKAQAEYHRNRFALSKSGPWAQHFDEMAMKTCIRKLAKRLPLSVEWNTAAVLDESAELGHDQGLGGALVIEGSNDSLGQVRDRLDNARANEAARDVVADPKLAEGELSPCEVHCITIHEAETNEQVDAAYLVAYSDPLMSKSDKAKISTAKEERLAELKAGGGSMFDGKEDPRDALR